jgi:hypothetical protein
MPISMIATLVSTSSPPLSPTHQQFIGLASSVIVDSF